MKKLFAILALATLLATVATPVVYDTAEENHPRPLVIEA